MNIWFTSDTHFGHANIIKYSERPFSNVDEMDAIIIRNWNDRVMSCDTVYHLGDFSFGNANKYLDRLAGNIIRVKGSHDPDINEPYLIRLKPDKLIDEYGNQRTIVLCHYAMRSWEVSHYGSWHLYGHHHGKLKPYGLSFDVGVDCWDYSPVSLTEVEAKMSKMKPIIDFRTK